MEKLGKAGLKLNKLKCLFNQTRVKFLGHYISANGLEADHEKIEAIRKLKSPNNRKQLQRLLGMVNYLAKFIQNLSSITEPLRKLLSKNIQFKWDFEQEEAFVKIKEVLTSLPVLQLYDVNLPVTLSVDASKYAIGAVLLQRSHPVAYASKSLTKAQQEYSQIEKEAYAIRFG
jgi:hypothetical protein